MRTTSLFILFLLALNISYSQNHTDVLHYSLEFTITDESDTLYGKEKVTVHRLNQSPIRLDLASLDDEGTGIQVSSVKVDETIIEYSHENNTLICSPALVSDTVTLTIEYKGIPTDGMVIGENKYNSRTFFGDNWPNRAHLWFACNDHPIDKATVEFTIHSPAHYTIIANGIKDKEEIIDGTKLTHYSTNYPIPTKVMVFGAADFVVEKSLSKNQIPIENYVYPENEKEGFHDMSFTSEILYFFETKFGPYPFNKLANVQSTTRFGGMENASCIFYDENAITGKQTMEKLMVHEIAHQWFGNSASEADWMHLWLSEGFATYLTDVYVQEKFGHEEFKARMANERKIATTFNDKYPLPIIDTISTDLMFQLNPNAYQRGAWVLHMLRTELGDSLFWEGLREYYFRFEYYNATSDDFLSVLEEVSKKELSQFKNQWLQSSAIPELKAQWIQSRSKVRIELQQLQKDKVFDFITTIRIQFKDGSIEDVNLHSFTPTTEINLKGRRPQIKCIVIDPEVKLLYK